MRYMVCIATLLLTAVPASAQSPSKSPNVQPGQAQTPLPGANSFIESQARAAIAAQGFDDISQLMNDSEGIWRGKARKGQRTFDVSVDYKGHVDAK